MECLSNNNPFRKKGMEFEFPLSFPETKGGGLTNQKGSVFVGNRIIAYPYVLPSSRNVLTELPSVITGRCQMVHNTPKEWTCLCYFSIIWQYKAFYY